MFDRIAKQRIRKALALAVFVCFYWSCKAVPRLVPHPSRLEVLNQIEQSKLIVVAVVDSDFPVGPVIPREENLLRLHKVGIHVENVLKGTASVGELQFFFYGPESAWVGVAFNVISPGRAIFFLVPDGDVFRATNDVYPSHIQVTSGRHPAYPQSETSLRQTIAEILLTPGEGVDMKSYLSSCPRSTALVLDVIGKEGTTRLLESLLKNGNGQVRGRACITLANFPFKDKECLPQLINDTEALAEDRERAKEQMDSGYSGLNVTLPGKLAGGSLVRRALFLAGRL